VIFVHPAIRQYRGVLYAHLQQRFDSKFLVIGFEDVNRRWADYFGIRNLVMLPETSFLAYRSSVSWPILRHAWNDDYDVWIASILSAFPTHAAFPVVKARRKLFVLWTEDWYWGDDWASRLARPYCREILSHLDLAIAAGTRQAEFLRAAGIPDSRIVVAPNSTLLLPSRDSTRLARRDASLFRVLYVGRLLDYKGADLLIEAYARLEAQAPGKTELCIWGQGPHEQRCREIVHSLGLTSVRFFGRVDPEDVRSVYESADVFVHPCRWMPGRRVKGEAWGFVINEAMACGLPVITTCAVAAASDLIQNGHNGFVIPANDVTALADQLLLLWKDPSLRHRVGASARETVTTRFTPEIQASIFCDAIQSLVDAFQDGHRR
jgi:glycosyltransferase involved in cell wall biosynthesis